MVSSPVSIELPGRLEAFRQAEVRARVAGIVTERLYKEGQDVRKGTPLFLINPELLKVARDEASGTLAKAEANYHDVADKLKRYKDLVSDHSISERDYQSAVAGENKPRLNCSQPEHGWKKPGSISVMQPSFHRSMVGHAVHW